MQKSAVNDSQKIKNIFESIADRYDLLNRLASLGLDSYWRRKTVQLINPAKNSRILDMCCGTGGLTFAFAKFSENPDKIVGCDFSENMITKAKLKEQKFVKKFDADNTYGKSRFDWVVCDCSKPPFEDLSFDIISCAFGLRNIPNTASAIAQMYRLLRFGGRACILEFTLPTNRFLQFFYLLYFRFVLPILGGLITGNTAAFRHLVKSVIEWDESFDLAKHLLNAGFKKVSIIPMSFGIVSVYISFTCNFPY